MAHLQTRLWLSFIALLSLTLALIGLLLMFFLYSRPIPLEDTAQNLSPVALEVDFREFVSATDRQNSRLLPEEMRQFLDALAQETGYRLLILRPNGQRVYDSAPREAGALTIREEYPWRAEASARRPTFLAYGVFEQADETWVYVRRPAVRERGGRLNEGRLVGLSFMVATPQPRQNFRHVLASFRATFFRPLLQAGCVSSGVALGLSIFLARSIARPMRRIAQSASHVAQGDYAQRVPVEGFLEARLLAETFNEMTAQVRQTQQAQRDFLANVTHDLRTPLTSIQGYSQAIMDGVAADPQATQNAARVIHEEAGRLTRMVSDLLDLAKIQAGRWQMLRQAVEIEAVLRRVGESLQIKAQQRGQTLHVQIAPLVRIAGDGDRLAQVFTNLVDNALKHTDQGGQVWLKAGLSAGGVVVEVQDTGEGIPPEDLTRIFERFYQVDKSRNRQSSADGAGLGLAITAEIIRAHAGKIDVQSQVGVGTCFRVWLPLMGGDRSTLISRKAR
jgi:signal transduction histidine kinase